MWMMDYNDGGDINMSDPINGGSKLRPLVARPMAAASNSINTSPSMNPPCFSRVHGHATEFFSLNHHLGTVTEQSRREFNTQPVLVSSRWNPTPEQLRTLEELYRRGTRTPSAEQIQHITSQLRRYGKIEGKNVFYWFQNHKARERQKRRRQMESATGAGVADDQHREIECLEKKESGASRTVIEIEQTKNWTPSTNCSTHTEESISIQRALKTGAEVVTECKTDGWLQFDDGELQQRRNFMEKNTIWAMMQLSCHPHPHPHPQPHAIHPIKLSPTPAATAVTTVDPKLINTHQHMNLYATPYREENGLNHLSHAANNHENVIGESQTLELFPLRSCVHDHHKENGEAAAEASATTMSTSNDFTTPHQFYEFIPLKK